MKVMMINNRPVKIWTNEVEDLAMEQIANLASLPFLFHHLAIMPDVHAGMGMPIGGVLATVDAVIPNAVGVDIGCGMCAVKTSWQVSNIDQNVLRKTIMKEIREAIPVGFSHHGVAQDEQFMPTGYDISSLKIVSEEYKSAKTQIGTLGGGNHFIELQRDEDGYLWVMIHSGSRNLGKKVCDYYDKIAISLNELWYSEVKSNLRLAFLPKGTPEYDAYWAEMNYCVDFALCNRRLMMERIKDILTAALPGIEFEPMINIAHNYAAIEHHFGHDVIVHRKGATLAREGVTGIIPGSQGTASYIVEGLGNPESFCSCSHGSGRLMSRTKAVQTLSLEDEIKRLDEQGIVHAIRTEKDLEEAAGAYKDIETVINNELDLVRIVTRLQPVAVVKG